MTRPARRDPSRLVEATGFRDFVGSGWGPGDREARLPDGAAQAARAHRQRLSDALPGKRIVVAAGGRRSGPTTPTTASGRTATSRG